MVENETFPENNLSPGERRELLARWDRSPENERNTFKLTSPDWTSARDIARFDREVASIIQDVPVSPLLRQRLIAQLDQADADKRRRLLPRRWAVAITSIAAGLLFFVMLQPFGKPSLDVNAVGSRIAGIHRLFIDEKVTLVAGRGSSTWPSVINSRTCVGHRPVELFGHRVTAYQLTAGNERAVLVVMPIEDFPFQIGSSYFMNSYSTRRIDVHYLVTGNQVCILVTNEGTDISSFKAAASVA